MIHLNPNSAILEKRFDRISSTILAGAETSIETNERPRRPEGSFDYSLAAKYLKINGLDQSHQHSKHRHFSKTPSHRLTREHLDVPFHEDAISKNDKASFDIDVPGVSGISLKSMSSSSSSSSSSN